MSSSHIIVVGGGVVGLASAYHLARGGGEVTLIERGDFSNGASTGNAGIIALGHPPMPRPGMTRQAFRMLLDPSNPLYIPLRADPSLLSWLWEFRKACTETQFQHSMAVLAELGWRAGEAFEQIVHEEALDCEYSPSGWMEIYRTPEKEAQVHHEAELMRRYGYNATAYDGPALRAIQPAFLEDVRGAIHYTDSAFANPGQFVSGLARRLLEHGIDVRTGETVERLIVSDSRARGVTLASGEEIRADTVLLAAGIWSRDLAAQIDVRVPMQPGKGYHINLTQPEPCVTTTCVLAETYVAVTPIGGGLRLAGTLEFSGINHKLVQRRLDMLRVGAGAYLHGIDDCETQSTWCGLRPCTADGLPVVGWAPRVEGLYIATGHAMMGFALGPVTGRLVSEDILHGASALDLSPLSPRRFDPSAPLRQRDRALIST